MKYIIFSAKSEPCLRIERWVLRLQSYNFEVVYKPVKDNIADSFSRLLNTEKEEWSFDEISEYWIRQIVEISKPYVISINELRVASEKDKTINIIKEALTSGIWGKELKQYELIQSELCFSANILLRGTRIIVPEILQKRTLELAHLAHGRLICK